jgi:hypothetical protein
MTQLLPLLGFKLSAWSFRWDEPLNCGIAFDSYIFFAFYQYLNNTRRRRSMDGVTASAALQLADNNESIYSYVTVSLQLIY